MSLQSFIDIKGFHKTLSVVSGAQVKNPYSRPLFYALIFFPLQLSKPPSSVFSPLTLGVNTTYPGCLHVGNGLKPEALPSTTLHSFFSSFHAGYWGFSYE